MDCLNHADSEFRQSSLLYRPPSTIKFWTCHSTRIWRCPLWLKQILRCNWLSTQWCCTCGCNQKLHCVYFTTSVVCSKPPESILILMPYKFMRGRVNAKVQPSPWWLDKASQGSGTDWFRCLRLNWPLFR